MSTVDVAQRIRDDVLVALLAPVAESVRALAGTAEADHSAVGIGLAALSLAVMPVLSYAQRRAGREFESASAVADSKQTLLCTYLTAVLLAGLVANAAFGWRWADPIAALVIAAVAIEEGREAWRGDTCCTPATALVGDHAAEAPGTDCADGCCSPASNDLAMAACARPPRGQPAGVRSECHCPIATQRGRRLPSSNVYCLPPTAANLIDAKPFFRLANASCRCLVPRPGQPERGGGMLGK